MKMLVINTGRGFYLPACPSSLKLHPCSAAVTFCPAGLRGDCWMWHLCQPEILFFTDFSSLESMVSSFFFFFFADEVKKKEPALPLSIAHSVWGKTLAFISQAYRTGQQRAGRGGRHPADVSAGRMVPTTEAHRRAWISHREPECSYHLSRIFVCRGLATFNCWWGLHF